VDLDVTPDDLDIPDGCVAFELPDMGAFEIPEDLDMGHGASGLIPKMAFKSDDFNDFEASLDTGSVEVTRRFKFFAGKNNPDDSQGIEDDTGSQQIVRPSQGSQDSTQTSSQSQFSTQARFLFHTYLKRQVYCGFCVLNFVISITILECLIFFFALKRT
jgi:hypothetical protein